MTNIYDVLSKMQVKATAAVEKAAEEDLEKEDPPVEQAKSILESGETTLDAKPTTEKADESTKGNARKRSSRSNKQNL